VWCSGSNECTEEAAKGRQSVLMSHMEDTIDSMETEQRRETAIRGGVRIYLAAF